MGAENQSSYKQHLSLAGLKQYPSNRPGSIGSEFRRMLQDFREKVNFRPLEVDQLATTAVKDRIRSLSEEFIYDNCEKYESLSIIINSCQLSDTTVRVCMDISAVLPPGASEEYYKEDIRINFAEYITKKIEVATNVRINQFSIGYFAAASPYCINMKAEVEQFCVLQEVKH
jgi:hypothetical protein